MEWNFYSVPFHSLPFHSVPFRSVSFKFSKQSRSFYTVVYSFQIKTLKHHAVFPCPSVSVNVPLFSAFWLFVFPSRVVRVYGTEYAFGMCGMFNLQVVMKLAPDRKKFMEVIGGNGDINADIEKFCTIFSPLLEQNHKFLVRYHQ